MSQNNESNNEIIELQKNTYKFHNFMLLKVLRGIGLLYLKLVQLKINVMWLLLLKLESIIPRDLRMATPVL